MKYSIVVINLHCITATSSIPSPSSRLIKEHLLMGYFKSKNREKKFPIFLSVFLSWLTIGTISFATLGKQNRVLSFLYIEFDELKRIHFSYHLILI